MVAPARRTDPSLQDVPRGMLAAAALLVGLASLIGLAGLATVAAALATAARTGQAHPPQRWRDTLRSKNDALRAGRSGRWTDRVEDVAAWVLLAAGLLVVLVGGVVAIGGL